MLTYRQFLYQYVYKHIKIGDKPYNRQLFNDSLDYVLREGLVSKQAEKWIYPSNRYFE